MKTMILLLRRRGGEQRVMMWRSLLFHIIFEWQQMLCKVRYSFGSVGLFSYGFARLLLYACRFCPQWSSLVWSDRKCISDHMTCLQVLVKECLCKHATTSRSHIQLHKWIPFYINLKAENTTLVLYLSMCTPHIRREDINQH